MKKLFLCLLLVFISITAFPKDYSISEIGLAHIKSYESCKLTSYRDMDGYYIIGWGHHSKSVRPGERITQARADQLFREDIRRIEVSANRLLRNLPYEYEFSQGFFDGFCSMVYNCGEGGIQKSLFYSKLKRCRVTDGVMNIEDFNYTLSLVKNTKAPTSHHRKRRLAEYEMMMKL